MAQYMRDKHVQWTLDDCGTLTISGTGGIDNFDHETHDNIPWYKDRDCIKKIIIEDGVTSIGNLSFECCENMTEVKIPKSVQVIGYSAFYDCTSLREINIPDSVTKICSGAFEDCSSLEKVTLSTNLTTICGCNTIVYEYYSHGIGGTFETCIALKSITIPEGVVFIGGYAFGYCSSLNEIKLPRTLKKIYQQAFQGCTGLKNITLPDSVIYVGDKVFNDCTNLEKIYYKTGSAFEDKLLTGNNAELIAY